MADTITINMPGKGDEKINPATLFVIREALPFEKEENPEVVSCAWGANFRIFPAETLTQLAEKFAALMRIRDLCCALGRERPRRASACAKIRLNVHSDSSYLIG